MRLLALDMAARTGWAVAHNGQIQASGEWLLEGDRAARFDKLYNRIMGSIEQHRVGYVIYERPFTRGAGSRVLWGYAAIAELAAHRHMIASIDELPTSLKKWATGSGHAKKPDMVAECERRTGKQVGPDEADAILLALYASERVEIS